MKIVLSAMCIATVFGVGAGASAQSPAAKEQMMKPGQMTLSGCVAAGKTDGQFMLTNAAKAGDMKGKEMDKDTTKKPDTMGAHSMSYALVGGDNLKAHLGHRVEVTGTVSKADMDHMAKTEKDPTAKDKMMANMDAPAMTLTVTGVKMVSATCP